MCDLTSPCRIMMFALIMLKKCVVMVRHRQGFIWISCCKVLMSQWRHSVICLNISSRYSFGYSHQLQIEYTVMSKIIHAVTLWTHCDIIMTSEYWLDKGMLKPEADFIVFATQTLFSWQTMTVRAVREHLKTDNGQKPVLIVQDTLVEKWWPSVGICDCI